MFTRACGSVYIGELLMCGWEEVLGKRYHWVSSTHWCSCHGEGLAVYLQAIGKKKRTIYMALYYCPSISRLDTELGLQSKGLPSAKRSLGGIYSGDGSPAAPGLVFSMRSVRARQIIRASWAGAGGLQWVWVCLQHTCFNLNLLRWTGFKALP